MPTLLYLFLIYLLSLKTMNQKYLFTPWVKIVLIFSILNLNLLRCFSLPKLLLTEIAFIPISVNNLWKSQTQLSRGVLMSRYSEKSGKFLGNHPCWSSFVYFQLYRLFFVEGVSHHGCFSGNQPKLSKHFLEYLQTVAPEELKLSNFWSMFPSYTTWKKPENQRFSSVFRGYKIGTLVSNRLSNVTDKSCLTLTW